MLWLQPEASRELDATLDWYARRGPRTLLTTTAILTGFDNTSDGERLLASVAAEPPRPAVRLFLNWAGMLPR